jgi:hypothetical protein
MRVVASSNAVDAIQQMQSLIWPQPSASPRTFQGELETLRMEIDKAVRALMEAGGNAV